MYMCLCKGITESEVRAAGQSGIVTANQLKAKFDLKCNGCCGRCAKNIHEFIEVAVQGAGTSCPRQ